MSQFGGSSRADDYGYFGPPKQSAAPSQLGSPAAAPSAFGTPAPAPAAGFGFPAPPSGSTARTRKRPGPLLWVLLAVLVLGALYLASAAYLSSRAHRPITVPATLGGLSTNTDADLDAAIATAEQGVRSTNPGINAEVAGYGGKRNFMMLVVVRGAVRPAREFADFATSSRQSMGAPLPVGTSTCVTNTQRTLSYCLRTTDQLTVEVAAVGGTTAQASAAVDEAWALQ